MCFGRFFCEFFGTCFSFVPNPCEMRTAAIAEKSFKSLAAGLYSRCGPLSSLWRLNLALFKILAVLTCRHGLALPDAAEGRAAARRLTIVRNANAPCKIYLFSLLLFRVYLFDCLFSLVRFARPALPIL